MKRLITLAAIVLCCISCLKSNDPTPQSVTVVSGIYILNNGNWGSNDSNLGSYNYQEFSSNIFEKVNKQKLGDLGQDILVYGNKMYIAVSNSGVIFVTDLSGKILSEVKAGPESNYQPRNLASYKGKVFISYYEGYVGSIDTVNFTLTLSDKIGNNPEGVAISNNKLYVAISNGLNYPDFDSTAAVLNPSTLALEKKLTIGLNPGKMVSCGDYVFCLCNGNYNDVADSLCVIYTPAGGSEDMVSTITALGTPVNIASDGKQYLFVAIKNGDHYDFASINCFTGTVYDSSIIKDGTVISNFVTSLDVDPVNYYIFIGTSDYVNNGDMYVFKPTGYLYKKFDTEGLNPIKTAFSTTTVIVQ